MHSSKKTAGRIFIATVAALILLHTVTGLLSQHSNALNLDQRYISWSWLMSHYGIGEAEPDAVFLVDNKILSQFDTQLFVDEHPVSHIHRPLVGGIALEDLMVLATDNALVLLTREGEFIERMGAEAGVPGPIQNIGTYHGEPVVQARNGCYRIKFYMAALLLSKAY